MKKIGYILFAAMGLASCSNDEIFEATANVAEESAQEVDFSRRSYSEVLQIAQNSIAMIQDSAAVTRGEEVGRTLNLESGVKTYCQKTTRANGASANDTLIYVFNFNDNKGFAVVSANRATEGLLAVVENGNYDPNSKWGDSFAEELLENANEYVANTKLEDGATTESGIVTRAKGDVTRIVSGSYVEEKTEIHKVTPRIRIEWAQKGTTARYCNNELAGSGPVAVVQVMAHYKYPYQFLASYADNSQRDISWNSIITNYNNSNKMLNKYFKNFSMLVREIGHRAGAQYKTGITITDISKLKDCMSSFNYKVSSVYSYNPKGGALSMAEKLNGSNTVIMQGTSVSGKTHTFIIDGCNYYRRRELYEVPNVTTYVISDRQVELNYINWGEGGMYNGYYNSSLLYPVTYADKDPNVCTGDEDNEYSGYFEGSNGAAFNSNMKYFTVRR